MPIIQLSGIFGCALPPGGLATWHIVLAQRGEVRPCPRMISSRNTLLAGKIPREKERRPSARSTARLWRILVASVRMDPDSPKWNEAEARLRGAPKGNELGLHCF